MKSISVPNIRKDYKKDIGNYEIKTGKNNIKSETENDRTE